jgi:hypothetical protein
MIRLGRRALLLAAVSLLTSAATACAECAWVLWQQQGEISPGGSMSSSDWTWLTPHAERREGMARDALHDRNGALADERDGHCRAGGLRERAGTEAGDRVDEALWDDQTRKRAGRESREEGRQGGRRTEE